MQQQPPEPAVQAPGATKQDPLNCFSFCQAITLLYQTGWTAPRLHYSAEARTGNLVGCFSTPFTLPGCWLDRGAGRGRAALREFLCLYSEQLCVQVMAPSDWGLYPHADGWWAIHVPASARGSAKLRGVSHRCPPPAGHRVRDDRWPRRMGKGRSALCLRIAACVPARVMRHSARQDQNGDNLFITGGVLQSRSFLWTCGLIQVRAPGLCVAT